MLSLSLNVGITTARSAVFRSLSFASKIIFSYQASHPKFGVKTHPISGVNVIAGLGEDRSPTHCWTTTVPVILSLMVSEPVSDPSFALSLADFKPLTEEERDMPSPLGGHYQQALLAAVRLLR